SSSSSLSSRSAKRRSPLVSNRHCDRTGKKRAMSEPSLGTARNSPSLPSTASPGAGRGPVNGGAYLEITPAGRRRGRIRLRLHILDVAAGIQQEVGGDD